jgi:hypothetical protein
MKMAVFWVVASCNLIEVYRRFTDAFLLIGLMMLTARTSKMTANFYQTTWRSNPEDSLLRDVFQYSAQM